MMFCFLDDIPYMTRSLRSCISYTHIHRDTSYVQINHVLYLASSLKQNGLN